MAEQRTIHFVSLGCPKNRVDTEVMLGVSGVSGYQLVEAPEAADVIVINTCGFIGAAKEESVDTILEMGKHKESGSCSTLVVAGCLSQRYPDELANEMPEVDHFLGSSDMLKLGDVLARPGKVARMLVGNPAEHTLRATDPRLPSMATHSAYVKIAEGCNRICSFCAIPSFRGKQRSRNIEDLASEAQALVERGAVELNLISQDTVSYGRDLKDGTELAKLVERLAETPGLQWLRVFYLYPETLSPHLLELLGQHPRVLPYVDMPLQHASDRMLKRMRRGHGIDRQKRVVEKLRKSIPDLVLRSAFIVGHPGEADEDFEELVSFVKWAELDRMAVFRYSHEDGTHAGGMEDLVPAKVSAARARKLVAAQRPISRKKGRAMIGTEVEVLVEGGSDESEFLLRGRWWGQAPEGIDGEVHLANGDAQPGEIRKALVTAAADLDLVADLADREGHYAEPPPGAKKRPKTRLRTLA